MVDAAKEVTDATTKLLDSISNYEDNRPATVKQIAEMYGTMAVLYDIVFELVNTQGLKISRSGGKSLDAKASILLHRIANGLRAIDPKGEPVE